MHSRIHKMSETAHKYTQEESTSEGVPWQPQQRQQQPHSQAPSALMQVPAPHTLLSSKSPATPTPSQKTSKQNSIKITASRVQGRKEMVAVAGCCGDKACAPSLLGRVPPAF